VPEKTQVAEATPPPAPEPLVPIATPARVEHTRRPTAMATVTVEPLTGSKIGRLVGKISPFRRKKQGFVPARAIHQVTPAVPANEHLERDVPVDLRVTVDPAGNVSEVEQASRNADRQLVRLASDAARSWQFVPARNNDETVTSELILHFRFPGSRNE
jgi:TonB family protein